MCSRVCIVIRIKKKKLELWTQNKKGKNIYIYTTHISNKDKEKTMVLAFIYKLIGRDIKNIKAIENHTERK